MDLRRPLPPGSTPTRPDPGPSGMGRDGRSRAAAEAARLSLIRAYCRPGRTSLLDVGCGHGGDLRALAPALALGVGVGGCGRTLQRARDAAAGTPNLRFALGDAVLFSLAGCRDPKGPAVPDRFDLVVLRADGLDPADLPRQLAAGGRRLLPGGRLLLLAPDARHPAWRWAALLRGEETDGGPPGLTPPLARAAAAACGLTPVALHRLPWPMPGTADPHPRLMPGERGPGLVSRLRARLIPAAVPLGGFAMALRGR